MLRRIRTKRKLLLFAIFLLIPVLVFADFGPKPSVTVEFENLSDEYYITLLGKETTFGPYRTDEVQGVPPPRWLDHDDALRARKAWDMFRNYQDSEGYLFMGFMDTSARQPFVWDYYPPQEFKVLIVQPDTGETLIGDQVQKTFAFDSMYRAQVNDGVITISPHLNLVGEIGNFTLRVILTIGIELAVAWLFGLRSPQAVRYILTVNIITQVLLHLFIGITSFYAGALAFLLALLLGEIIVWLVESKAYAKYFPSHDIATSKKAWAYAFVANALSFATGLLIAIFIPGVL